MKPSHIRSQRGVALVTTVIVVTVMATIAVALLQSTGTDRLSSRTVANHFKARLFADAGAADAINALVSTSINNTATGSREFMVNSYVERPINFDGATVNATYLATHRLGTDLSSVAETRLLVSTGNYADITAVPAENLVDLNNLTSCASPNPIGLTDNSTGTPVPRPVPAGWTNVLRNPDLAEDNNPASPNYNPVIGRFAYWIDDESAKLDIKTAGNLTAAGGIFRGAGTNPNQISPVPFLRANNSADNNPAEFIRNRDQISAAGALLSADTASLLDGDAAQYLSANWDGLKSMLTTYSRGDERGPLGYRKINLNDFVARDTDLSSASARDRIATATVALGDYIDRVLPGFGNRTYNGTVSPSDRRRYCIQIAANIRDYIDADSQPTAITQNFRWLQPPNPNEIGAGAPTQPPLAFGKEIVPSITEYVGYYHNSGGTLRIDHSFEILNIYTSPVEMASLGALTILVSERNPIEPINPLDIPPTVPGTEGSATPPLRVNLPAAASFPAGEYRIITTLPPGALRLNWTSPTAAPPLEATSNESTYAYGSSGLRMRGDANSTSDVATEISLVNAFGYLDFHARVAQAGFGATGSVLLESADPPRLIATQPFGNDDSSAGANRHRSFPLDSGDPRSQTDIYPNFSEGGALATSVAWRWISPDTQLCTVLGGDSNELNYGFRPGNDFANAQYMVPEPLLQTGPNSLVRQIATIRNGPMRNIGELGLVYDPAVNGQGNDNTSGQPTRQRGGFRTLAIGSDVGEARGPNRLAHTMPTAGNNTITQLRAYRLLDIFTANSTEQGKILVNSSLRDPGNLPLRSLFESLQFQSNTTSNSTSEYAAPADSVLGASGESIDVDALLEDWKAFEGNSGPFLSIGQIADLETFRNAELGVDLAPNSANTNALDRGREELLRNTFGLLTLKGSVYKIYAIGQTGTMDANGEFQVGSTAFLEKTVELERQYPQANGVASTNVDDLQTNNRATAINVKTISAQFN